MIDAVRYTLDEARREIARQECAANGHRWDIIEEGTGAPLMIVCSRCDGPSYNVIPNSDPQ